VFVDYLGNGDRAFLPERVAKCLLLCRFPTKVELLLEHVPELSNQSTRVELLQKQKT
jgi:hypothetical protein